MPRASTRRSRQPPHPGVDPPTPPEPPAVLGKVEAPDRAQNLSPGLWRVWRVWRLLSPPFCFTLNERRSVGPYRILSWVKSPYGMVSFFTGNDDVAIPALLYLRPP